MNIFNFLFGSRRKKMFTDPQQRATSNSSTGGLSANESASPFYTSIFPLSSTMSGTNENPGSNENNAASPGDNWNINTPSSDSSDSGGSYDSGWDSDSSSGDSSGGDSGGGDGGGGS